MRQVVRTRKSGQLPDARLNCQVCMRREVKQCYDDNEEVGLSEGCAKIGRAASDNRKVPA